MLRAILVLAVVLSGSLTKSQEIAADPIVKSIEAKLREALADVADQVEFEYANNGKSLIAKYRTRRFMIHGASKSGRYSEAAHEEEGPDFEGFLLRVHLDPAGTVNQAVVPQTIRQTYWQSKLDVRLVDGTDKQVYVPLSYGARVDAELVKRIENVLEELGDRPGHDVDMLIGVLRVHPKFSFRYYIDGFGDGQKCALFQADEQLEKIAPGTTIRVRGELGSAFHGVPNDPTAAIIPTWVIHMNVRDVDIVRATEGE